MYNDGLIGKLKKIADETDYNFRCMAPDISENIRTQVHNTIMQNLSGNSFNESDQNGWGVDNIFNNGLMNIPREFPDLQERYINLALYYFENYTIQNKEDDPIMSTLGGIGRVCSILLLDLGDVKLIKDPSFFKQIIGGLLQVYEGKTEELKNRDQSLEHTCRDLVNIGKKTRELYYALSYYLRGDVPEEYKEQVVQLKKIVSEESELRKPDIVVKIWEHVKLEHLGKKE